VNQKAAYPLRVATARTNSEAGKFAVKANIRDLWGEPSGLGAPAKPHNTSRRPLTVPDVQASK
jgi:hypothetical protein